MKLLALALAAILSLSACTGTGTLASAPATPAPSDLWSDKCKTYESPQNTQPYAQVYEIIIADLCSSQRAYEYQLNYEYSETVNKEFAEKFTDGLIFALDYWSNYAPKFEPANFILFSENDQAWWEQKQIEYLKEPDLGWFTSKDEGWHCRVEADIFCPKNFMPEETNNGQRVEFRIIGSMLNWEPRHNVNMAHEVVHAYQDEVGISHYREWLIEGQATFFELAFAYLYYGTDEGRANYLNNPKTQDVMKFTASTAAEVTAHIEACRARQDNPCDSFKYGVGMMYHEKLVLDYGLDAYKGWLSKMASTMPKGNLGGLDQEATNKMEANFTKIFEKSFGVSLEKFEYEIMPQYIVDSYKNL